METSWHQNRSKNRFPFGKAILQKSCSRCSGGSIFQDLGVQVGRKKRIKIKLKKQATRGRISASIFRDLDGFLVTFRGPKSIKKGIEEMMTKKMIFGRHLGARIINRFQPEKANFRKSCSRSSGGTIFQDLGQLMGRFLIDLDSS